MISLVPRVECLRANPVLAHAVRGMQDAQDPARDYNRETWAGHEDEGAAWFAAYRDDGIAVDPDLRFASGLTLYVPTEYIHEYVEALPDAVERLLEALGEDALTFVHGARSGRWPTRRRTPEVLAEAAADFRSLGAGGGFDGGIRADRESLADVLVPLFWSVRMDVGYGQVFFAPDRAPLVATLCQYGNLHLNVYGDAWPNRVEAAAHAAGFARVREGCEERFGAGGRIDGRWMPVR